MVHRQEGFIHEKNVAYDKAIRFYKESCRATRHKKFGFLVRASAWWRIGLILSGKAINGRPGAINAYQISIQALDKHIEVNPMDVTNPNDVRSEEALNPRRKRAYISMMLKQLLRANASDESH